jgi:hypothetical protein
VESIQLEVIRFLPIITECSRTFQAFLVFCSNFGRYRMAKKILWWRKLYNLHSILDIIRVVKSSGRHRLGGHLAPMRKMENCTKFSWKTWMKEPTWKPCAYRTVWWRWSSSSSCRWGETTFMKCCRQRAYCWSFRRYLSMENHSGIISTGKNSWFVYHSSLAILPAEYYGSREEERATGMMNLALRSICSYLQVIFYMP